MDTDLVTTNTDNDTSVGSTSTSLDITPITQRLDNLTTLCVFQSIIIFSILIFLAFEIALRGFFKIGK